MSLNLHALVGDALTIVNDWKNLVFTKTITEWVVTSRTPRKTKQYLVLKGKIQPASTQEIKQLGVDVTAYEYFRVYMTGQPTQLDRIRQFASDTFTCDGYTYRIVSKQPWDDAGWREVYAYRDTYEEPTPPPAPEPDEPTDEEVPADETE